MPEVVAVQFECEGTPVRTPAKRAGIRKGPGGKLIPIVYDDTSKTKIGRSLVIWRSDLRDAARRAMMGRAPFSCPLWIHVVFIFPRNQEQMKRKYPDGLLPFTKAPDRDNLHKGFADALEGICWINDSLLFDGPVGKYYAERNGHGRTLVRIEPFHQNRILTEQDVMAGMITGTTTREGEAAVHATTEASPQALF